MVNHFSIEEAAGILGIREGRLRYWRRIRLVTPSVREKGRPYYDFQDLICLRTAQGLVTQGVPATRVKRSIDSLKKKFPGSDDYLANKRIFVFGQRAIVSHKDRLMDTQSGQLMLKFDVDDLSREVNRRVRDFETRKTAQDWFQEGLRCDRSEKTHQKALHAYREALKLDPNFADAYVNMGNIYYAQKKHDDARRCYRLAVERDPSHPQGHFNLGNVMDELGSPEDAIALYQKAIEADPHFQDAYHNLAATCEKLHRWDQALRHWKSYLRLEPEAEQARYAEKRIKLLQSNLVPK